MPIVQPMRPDTFSTDPPPRLIQRSKDGIVQRPAKRGINNDCKARLIEGVVRSGERKARSLIVGLSRDEAERNHNEVC